MRKEQVDLMYSIMDSVFNNINESNKQRGSGLSFSYELKILPPDPNEDKPAEYQFEITLREMGHGERVLQTLRYHKPDSYDIHTMKSETMIAVLTVMCESTMLQWNEIGKMLNTDSDLQKAAIDVK